MIAQKIDPALLVAAIAVLISVVSLAISYWQATVQIREIRRSHPKIEIHGIYTDKLHIGGNPDPMCAVSFALSNRGKDATQVTSFLVAGSSFVINGGVVPHTGPKLPVTLSGYSSETWTIECEQPIPEKQLELVVALGHGEQLNMLAELDSTLEPIRRKRPLLPWRRRRYRDRTFLSITPLGYRGE